MQPAIHDPYAAATPSQRKAATDRLDRLNRIGSAARPQLVYSFKPTTDAAGRADRNLAPIPNSDIQEALELITRLSKVWCKVEFIQRAVVESYPRITLIDLLSMRRDAAVVRPRQIAMYLSKTLTERSLPDIGRRFGRDHTTVLHAVSKITALIETDPKLALEIEHFRKQLGNL